MRTKLIVYMSSLALTACTWMQPYSNEVAAINLSVNNVTPWANISAQMQPNFSLSGTDALSKVLPATELVQQQTLSAFYLGLGFGYKLSGSATASDAPTPAAATPVVLPSAPSTGTAAVSVQPTMQYEAANNLFEKVQMLNRDITDAAIQKHYTPYLVRFKLAVRPFMQDNLAYDVDTRVSFIQEFCDEEDDPDNNCLNIKEVENRKQLKELTQTLKVIPLLVTDDLERQLNANAKLDSTQLNAALGAVLPHGLAATLNEGYLNQQQSSVQGQAYNNRLSVKR